MFAREKLPERVLIMVDRFVCLIAAVRSAFMFECPLACHLCLDSEIFIIIYTETYKFVPLARNETVGNMLVSMTHFGLMLSASAVKCVPFCVEQEP